MLLLEPAGADAELDAAAGHLVHLRDRDRQRAGEAEGDRGDQRAEADPPGLAGQARQGDPGVGRAGQSVAAPYLQVVVGPEEGVEAEVLGGLRHGEEGLVRGALLGFGEDAQVHDPSLAYSTGVPRSRSPFARPGACQNKPSGLKRVLVIAATPP